MSQASSPWLRVRGGVGLHMMSGTQHRSSGQELCCHDDGNCKGWLLGCSPRGSQRRRREVEESSSSGNAARVVAAVGGNYEPDVGLWVVIPKCASPWGRNNMKNTVQEPGSV